MERWARKEIDIEHLLIWAFQAQRADRHQVAGPGGYVDSCVRIAGLAAFECKIDRSVVYGSPDVHPDALAVVDAVEMIRPPFNTLIVHHARGGTRPSAR